MKAAAGLMALALLFATGEARAKTLATVGKEKITVQEFTKVITREEKAAKRKLSKEEKQALLQTMVNQRLLIAEAKKRKLDKKDPLKSVLEARDRELLAQAIYELEVFMKVRVSDSQIRDFYDKNPKLFDVVNASQILVRPLSADKKDAALKEAKRLKRKATRKNFASLAKKHSDDNLSKERGGSLGTLRPGMLLPVLEKAIYAAKKGAFIGPVESRFGYDVFYIEDRKVETFEEARELIERELKRARSAELQSVLINTLKKKHKISIKNKLMP